MLKVELISFNDLSEKEKKEQPNNGSGKEFSSYLKISRFGETLLILSDSAEPEDATFSRAFKPVLTAIELAYKEGIKDGKKLK